MLRSFTRVPRSSSSLLLRPSSNTQRAAPLAIQLEQQRAAHAISNPTLANIEKRWEGMPPQEQAQLWMDLRDRMKSDWHELTLQERKAAYWIAFGPHGPRAQAPPGENFKVFWMTMVGVAASLGVFALIRSMAGPAPKTMNKEWQEATNEYLKAQNSEPITGLSAKGYEGPGHVQSGPAQPE